MIGIATWILNITVWQEQCNLAASCKLGNDFDDEDILAANV